jgi:hypothetical protein
MAHAADTGHVEIVVLLFLLVVGPLAVLYGVDSRIDEHGR